MTDSHLRVLLVEDNPAEVRLVKEALTSFLKQKQVMGLFTSTTVTVLGGSSVTEAHISSLTDSIVLLRYVEMYGEMKRGIIVLKMRGSQHDKDIRGFEIDGGGMHIGHAFQNVTGILGGSPSYVPTDELARMGSLFNNEGEEAAGGGLSG